MKHYIILLALCCFILSCKETEKQSEEIQKEDTELSELFGLMQGSFNSEIQAKVDSSYYNISLHMYPIWEDKGHFLYVEQALTSAQNKPYRQRIYEVTRLNDSLLSSAVYSIPRDSLWIGKWKTPKAFDSISKSDLMIRKGCEVLLQRKDNNYYVGKTGDNTCESSLRGAAYARSEVEILEDKIISWDRGFDAEGEHVWGAEKGGYIFNKMD
ncbi:chromophore lyase CpcT/CpeT [Ichthyenterobacterium sp. W332]|uniref:Chromophore lyase CpcT/CpeT n=1 Tax=Microcosmobacter mediterraneus TaxID=3075607 RepID=A0ABU2YN51_9FLAO|nr:chromophore lyase CpcT/CpeT [Ichthyenterobacterium sp. W332]MDT0559316.1 chromophore lyase CpcT/CpeT [Ichthyenterobacterium sp. W332]